MALDLNDVVEAASIHYGNRHFSPDALEHLKKTIRQGFIVTSVHGGPQSVQKTTRPHLRKPVPVDQAIKNLPANVNTRGPLESVDAIFAFSFGYRTKSRPAVGAEGRLPGKNNHSLAGIASDLKKELNRPLFAQFEISDAISDLEDGFADVSSPAEDLGTGAVAESFLYQAAARSLRIHRVAVVAHQHHLARCILILTSEFSSLEAVSADGVYDGYDPREAQPRVASQNAFVENDFVSMIAHAPW